MQRAALRSAGRRGAAAARRGTARRPLSTKTAPHPFESFLSGTSSNYVEEMYAAYKASPESVHVSWRSVFAAMDKGVPAGAIFTPPPTINAGATLTSAAVAPADAAAAQDHVKVMQLVQAFQSRGHNICDLDPLGMYDADLDGSMPPELELASYGFTEVRGGERCRTGDGGLPATASAALQKRRDVLCSAALHAPSAALASTRRFTRPWLPPSARVPMRSGVGGMGAGCGMGAMGGGGMGGMGGMGAGCGMGGMGGGAGSPPTRHPPPPPPAPPTRPTDALPPPLGFEPLFSMSLPLSSLPLPHHPKTRLGEGRVGAAPNGRATSLAASLPTRLRRRRLRRRRLLWRYGRRWDDGGLRRHGRRRVLCGAVLRPRAVRDGRGRWHGSWRRRQEGRRPGGGQPR